ncbi:MAG: PilN domain-containing protein [Pseudomonadota bacterium]
MIKVNLLRSQQQQSEEQEFVGTEVAGLLGPSKEEQVAVLQKIGIIMLPTLLLIGYEWYNVSLLTDQKTKALSTYKKAERELNLLNQEMKLYADVEQEAKVLEDKIGILRELSRIRLREVKALDFLQSVTPEAVWFSSIEYTSLRFVFKGFAVTDDALSAFIRELENSAYFTEVILMKATEEKNADGTVKVFEIQAQSGGIG